MQFDDVKAIGAEALDLRPIFETSQRDLVAIRVKSFTIFMS